MSDGAPYHGADALDAFAPDDLPFDDAGTLGTVVGGSLSRGLEVRLDAPDAVEETKVGVFVTVQGKRRRYFGIVTDLTLESTDQRLAGITGEGGDLLAEALSGSMTDAVARVTPMLTTSVGEDAPQPARSLPAHFAPVRRASPADVQAVFGAEDARHVYVGNPLDMEDTRVCLNVDELVKRANGVFGKSGTGKSFLTRILLAGVLQRGVAVNLVFDMHGEYGWQGHSERGPSPKGLKQLFPGRVAVFSLDAASARKRGFSADYDARIGFDEVEPEDIAVLAPTLNVTDLGVQACYSLQRHFGAGWIKAFLGLDADASADLAATLNESPSTLDALRRRLRQLERLDFMTDRAQGRGAVSEVLDYLTAGKHVVLEFGRHGDNLTAYLLVANLLTRRIHAEYRRRTEEALAANAQGPAPLVITIEEAHRFLSRDLARQTIFGAIAREMRKYRVTLLVVDQRPSGIDDEVLSQIGTRITCQLDDERDVDAVLTGAPGARELKGVLSRLEAQQQALLFGHALPMPVVVRTRDYGASFYAEMAAGMGTAGAAGEKERAELFG